MKQLKLVFFFTLISTTIFSQHQQKTMKDILSEYKFKTYSLALDSLTISYVKEGKGEKEKRRLNELVDSTITLSKSE